MATQLYIGYMDEEVAALLLEMLDERRTTTLVVFERGLVTQKTAKLFERPIARYTDDFGRTPTFDNYEAEELFKSKGGGAKYGDYVARRVRRRTDERQELKTLSSVVTKITLTPKEPKGDPIYFIRAPEMGKQPGLVRLYLRMIIRHLKKLEKVQEVAIGSFGTGGGIVTGGSPGALHVVKGSVFVGPDVDDEGVQFPNVELVYEADGGKRYERKGPLAVVGHGSLAARAEEIFYGDRMLIDLRQVLGSNAATLANAVSATFSYFDGSTTKRAVDLSYNNLVGWEIERKCYNLLDKKKEDITLATTVFVPAGPGLLPRKDRKGTDFIVNANMEDYHLLRVFRTMKRLGSQSTSAYPTLAKTCVVRVDSNVVASKELEALVETYVKQKLQDVRLTQAEYQRLMKWGEGGCPFTKTEIGQLPAVATSWHKQLGGKQDELDQLAVFWFKGETPTLVSGEPPESNVETYCMEPFCMEIATDFRDANAVQEDKKYPLWVRGGNKWKDIPVGGFLPEVKGAIKALERPENLDRILYKSSGAAALQICVKKAYAEHFAELGT